jgi:CheY-like chemotaxis protein
MIEPARVALRVLVVDDNRDSAEMLQVLLGMMGHTVDVAFDGRSAMIRVREQKPQVVLLDIGLPDVTGYDVAREIRKSGISPICLIALTGWGQEEARQEALEAGFDHHLTKPADPADLERLLATVSV